MAKRAAAAMRGTPEHLSAIETLSGTGVPYALHSYVLDGDASDRGRAAAAAMGIAAERVFRTVLLDVDGGQVLAVLPVGRPLDTATVAAAVGRATATVAFDPSAGGPDAPRPLSPLGHDLPVIVDASAVSYPSIVVSSGHLGVGVEIQPDMLLGLLNARTAPLAGFDAAG